MRGNKSLGADNPCSWLPNVNWLMVNSLAKLDGFAKFPSDLGEASPDFWNGITMRPQKLKSCRWTGLVLKKNHLKNCLLSAHCVR